MPFPQSPNSRLLCFWEPQSSAVAHTLSSMGTEGSDWARPLLLALSLHSQRQKEPHLAFSSFQLMSSPSEPLCHFLPAPNPTPHSKHCLTLLMVLVKQKSIAGRWWGGEGREPTNLFGPCIKRNNGQDFPLQGLREVPCLCPPITQTGP